MLNQIKEINEAAENVLHNYGLEEWWFTQQYRHELDGDTLTLKIEFEHPMTSFLDMIRIKIRQELTSSKFKGNQEAWQIINSDHMRIDYEFIL